MFTPQQTTPSQIALFGQGSSRSPLGDATLASLFAQAFAAFPATDQRVLTVIPHVPVMSTLPRVFDTLYATLAPRLTALDLLLPPGATLPSLHYPRTHYLVQPTLSSPGPTIDSTLPPFDLALLQHITPYHHLLLLGALTTPETLSPIVARTLAEGLATVRPVTCVAIVQSATTLHGLYIGHHVHTWRMAANLAACLSPTA